MYYSYESVELHYIMDAVIGISILSWVLTEHFGSVIGISVIGIGRPLEETMLHNPPSVSLVFFCDQG